jgi:hypothetical protein
MGSRWRRAVSNCLGRQAEIGARASEGERWLVRLELAALRHRVARVRRQVEQRLLELSGVGHHPQRLAGAAGLEGDLLADDARQQLAGSGDDLVQVHRLQIHHLLAAEREQA